MITNFNEQLWIDFDLEIAVFLENMAVWLRYNASKTNPEHRNFHEGRYWSFDSYPELAKRFKGWSSKTMRTIIARCAKHELIIIGNFNKKKYDNTNWYTFTDKALEYYPLLKSITLEPSAQSGRDSDQSGRPIPEELNSLKENTTTSSSNSKPKEKNLNFIRDMIDVYREIFPNNPQPHAKLISTTLLKTLQTLIKRWPEADPNGKPLDIVAFRKYLEYLKLSAPQFALGEWENKNGKMKKNDLVTFARWNTLVNCLEEKYS